MPIILPLHRFQWYRSENSPETNRRIPEHPGAPTIFKYFASLRPDRKESRDQKGANDRPPVVFSSNSRKLSRL